VHERPRITVLNQSEAFLELVDTLLEEEAPYHVTTLLLPTVSPNEVAATAPQLIIADLTAEREHAPQMLREILAFPEMRQVPVILTTPASDSPASRLAELRDHPNLTQLAKPFTAEALEDLVRRLLPIRS
jgi:CheY-like chemotaxis protein